MKAAIINDRVGGTYISSDPGLKTKSYQELRPGLYSGPLSVDQFREEARGGLKLVFKGSKIFIDYPERLGIHFEKSIFGLREIPGHFTYISNESDQENSVREQKILDGYIDLFLGKLKPTTDNIIAVSKDQTILYYLTKKEITGLEKISDVSYYGLLYNSSDLILPRLIKNLNIYKLGEGNYGSFRWRDIN